MRFNPFAAAGLVALAIAMGATAGKDAPAMQMPRMQMPGH
jgi:hypothetical protein